MCSSDLNTPRTLIDDPHFKARFPWLPAAQHGADMMPFAVHFLGEQLPPPNRAPAAGEHSEAVLREVLGYTPEQIAELRGHGVTGGGP